MSILGRKHFSQNITDFLIFPCEVHKLPALLTEGD